MASTQVHAEATTVLIVGGGPVGLAAAFELGKRAVSCLVVEPRRAVSWDRPRAKTTSARTMEHLRRWGIADAVRARALLPVAYSDEVVFCTGLVGREITRFDECFALTPAPVELYAEAGQQIPQPLFEEVLREQLRALPTVQMLLGWRVVALEQTGSEVHADLVNENGETRHVAASYAIGCDGSRSLVRESIGAQYLGTTDLRPNLNLVFRAGGLHELHHYGPAIHYWVLNSRVAGVLGPMDLDETWWVIATGATVLQEEPLRIIRELVGAEIDAEVLSIDPWNARMALASSYREGRVFLAGDAAHLNPPWGGHGFNTGVGDAVNLGWKLAAVLQGWGGEVLLASYEPERRRIASETIALAAANMQVLAVDLADPALEADGAGGDRARDLAAAHIRATKSAEFHSLGLVLGYAYDSSPVVIPHPVDAPLADPARYVPSARPGSRLPHHWLDAGLSLYDVLGDGFTLLLTREGVAGTGFRAAATARAMPLEVLDLSSRSYRDLSPPAILVRPDQHIAWCGEPSAIDPGKILDMARGAAVGPI